MCSWNDSKGKFAGNIAFFALAFNVKLLNVYPRENVKILYDINKNVIKGIFDVAQNAKDCFMEKLLKRREQAKIAALAACKEKSPPRAITPQNLESPKNSNSPCPIDDPLKSLESVKKKRTFYKDFDSPITPGKEKLLPRPITPQKMELAKTKTPFSKVDILKPLEYHEFRKSKKSMYEHIDIQEAAKKNARPCPISPQKLESQKKNKTPCSKVDNSKPLGYHEFSKSKKSLYEHIDNRVASPCKEKSPPCPISPQKLDSPKKNKTPCSAEDYSKPIDFSKTRRSKKSFYED